MAIRNLNKSWQYDFTLEGHGRRRKAGFRTKAEAREAERRRSSRRLGHEPAPAERPPEPVAQLRTVEAGAEPAAQHAVDPDHAADVEPRTLLVHWLRDELGLTGTNIGCDTSQCGSCTVHVNGAAVKSCTMLAAQADGSSVTTMSCAPAWVLPNEITTRTTNNNCR